MPIVRREVTVPADRDAAWEAVSTVAGLESWLADRVDGAIAEGEQATFSYADGSERVASIDEVVDGERVAWRWSRPGDAETRVVVAVARIAVGAARITVTESGPVALADAAAWSPRGRALRAALRRFAPCA